MLIWLRKSSRALILFFTIANLYFFLSNIPLLTHIVRNSADKVFPLVHTEFTHDYYLYLSVITEGKYGNWLYQESYTSEPTQPGIFLIFYIITGRVAALFNVSAPLAYHIARIISVELYILAIFLLAKIILGPRFGFWGALFSIIGTVAPPLFFTTTLNYLSYPTGITWWSSLDSFARLDGLPHHIFGQALFIFSFAFFFMPSESQNESMKNHVFFITTSALCAFLAILIFPPTAAPLAVGIAFLIFYHLRVTKKIPVHLTIVTLASLIAFGIVKWQEKQGFPWNMWRVEEIVRWNSNEPSFDHDLPLIFSILPILSMGALIHGIRKKSPSILFLALWSVTPFLFLPFTDILHIPKIRLLQSAPFVPFGILTGITIKHVMQKRGQLIGWFLILFLFISSLPVSLSILNNRLSAYEFYASGYRYHIPQASFSSILFIEKNIPKNSIILSQQLMGNILPAFAPIRTYLGHVTHTKNLFEKEQNSRRFFGHEMTQNEARDFLITNNIQYVYFGEYERILSGKSLTYPFLTLIYDQDGIQIFKLYI